MKKIILLITLLILAGFTVGVSAQETELPDPGLTPDSPFYFLETIAEGIGTFFTFGDLKKAERYTTLAAERLAEAKAIVEKGKPEFAEKTLQRYENQLNNSIARAKKAMVKAKSAEKALQVLAKVGKATSVHLEVLAEVYEKVPEQAKPAIEKAMGVSVREHEKAVRILRARNALGEVPREVSLPVKIPEEARERIQRKVQEESAKEEAELRSLEFKSFKALETFCLEEGGPPELCTSFEAVCKEHGITTVNECFRAVTNVEIKAMSAPPLSEEEMEERRIQGEADRVRAEEALRKTEEELRQSRILSMPKVTIYSMPTCTHCMRAKEWFQENNIEYEEFDVSQDEKKRNELIEKVGQMVVPVIEVGDETIIGFDKKKLSELLGVK